LQAFAEWLVARPQNAVLALAVTMLLPAPQLTSGVVLSMIVLAQGLGRAAVQAVVAAGVLLAVSLLLGSAPGALLQLVVGTWLPVTALTLLLVRVRSLTLTMQLLIILIVMGMLGFYVVVEDPVTFWQPYLTAMEAIVRQNNLQLNTELLTAEVMTVSAALALWLLYAAALLLGYLLFRQLPRGTADFGRFRDLNFGRVLASAMALASLLAVVVDVDLVQNVAFVLFVTFWLQGLAIVHWLHGEGFLPVGAVVAVYILLPLLQVLLITALAILGFTDAWFGYRRRMRKA